MAIVTLLAMPGCSTIHLLPTDALDAPKSAPDTSKTARSLKPGHWYLLRSYIDRKGEIQSVAGRVRAVAGDSLEFVSYSSSTWSLAPLAHRSVVPRDSVRFVEVSQFNTGQTILLVGAVTAVIIVFVVQLGNALEHFEFPILPTH